MLCLLVGVKGEKDGLELTGLVGREERAKRGRRCKSTGTVVVGDNGFCN